MAENGAGTGTAVRARDLVRRYGDRVVVDGIRLDVRTGECFGVLGPNGAGKSTTMRMLAGLTPRTGGELSVVGLDPGRDPSGVRARIGIVSQQNLLDNELTVEQNIVVYGRFFGIPRRTLRARVPELLEFARLTDRRGHRVSTLSGGMQRRLAIARSLVNDPALVLFDEPSAGLDPASRHRLWTLIGGLRDRGITVLITTHAMEEAEFLCERVAIMDHGVVIGEGTTDQLRRRHGADEVVEIVTDLGDRPVLVGVHVPESRRLHVLGNRIVASRDATPAVRRRLADHGIGVESAIARRGTLEDVFLRLTGRDLSPDEAP